MATTGAASQEVSKFRGKDLETLAEKCKKLRQLRIERGEDEYGLEDEQGGTFLLYIAVEDGVGLEYLPVDGNVVSYMIGDLDKNIIAFSCIEGWPWELAIDSEDRMFKVPGDGVDAEGLKQEATAHEEEHQLAKTASHGHAAYRS